MADLLFSQTSCQSFDCLTMHLEACQP